MVEFVSFNPPRSCLHQQRWIVVPIGKKSIEGQSNRFAFLCNFGVADVDDLASEVGGHDCNWVRLLRYGAGFGQAGVGVALGFTAQQDLAADQVGEYCATDQHAADDALVR